MNNRLKRPSVWKIMLVLLGVGVFFILAALLGGLNGEAEMGDCFSSSVMRSTF